LEKYFSNQATQRNGMHYHCALVLVLEALKRVKAFM